MPVAVKDAASSAAKFVTNASAAAPSYATGVQGAGPKWAAATSASAPSYAAGVTAAITSGRFAGGVNSASQAKYQQRASTVGPQRYAQGVQGAANAYQTATAPYLQVIAGLNLPARQPKGSAANIQRVTTITEALRAKKLGTGQ